MRQEGKDLVAASESQTPSSLQCGQDRCWSQKKETQLTPKPPSNLAGPARIPKTDSPPSSYMSPTIPAPAGVFRENMPQLSIDTPKMDTSQPHSAGAVPTSSPFAHDRNRDTDIDPKMTARAQSKQRYLSGKERLVGTYLRIPPHSREGKSSRLYFTRKGTGRWG